MGVSYVPANRSPFEDGALPPGDLVAVGGSLDPSFVLDAYRHGVFPWFAEGEPALWWSPDPRGVLPIDGVHVSRRLARTVRGGRFEVRLDTSFEEVMRACARGRADGTWIHEGMVRCYGALHRAGHAHALEVWRDGALAGGVYGVSFGAVFAAESMFHVARDASKVALVALARHLGERGYELLDVQFTTPHLERMGAVEIPRAEYLARLAALRDRPVTFA